ncbi:MAG: hypothetical protein LKJ88_08550 [Bacilli bacterium]|jgi:tRNA pseudouridine38-40 synthase|nr:hypothetical protein [Bacilli bacterium]
MTNYLLTISFLGSSLYGSQAQKGLPTAQSVLEKALEKDFHQKIKTHPASRLDGGVSARGWSVAFKAEGQLDPEKVKYMLNRALVRTMHVEEVKIVSDDFVPRFQAKKKVYSYLINFGERNPLKDYLAWAPSFKGDKEIFKKTMMLFEGQHDFSAFMSEEDKKKDCTFKEVEKIEILEEGDYLKVMVKGHSFGRYQVRFMVGAAFYASAGLLKEEEIIKRLNGEEKETIHFKAPPEGLVLEEVIY